VNRKPNFLRVRSSLGDVRNQEFHRCRSHSSPLLRHIDRQVKQVRVRARVSEGNDCDHRVHRRRCERLPVEVTRPHVRLGENDQGDRLMTRDEPDLVRRHLYGYRGPPVALIDRCQSESRRIFHGTILAPPEAPGNG